MIAFQSSDVVMLESGGTDWKLITVDGSTIPDPFINCYYYFTAVIGEFS